MEVEDKTYMTFLNRMAPIVLLTAASGFAGAIGSLAEANLVDTSQLLVTDWGIARGSYLLSFDQASSGGNAAIAVVSPSSTPTPTTANNENSTSNSNDRQRAPIFVTQPNLGFQVVLTADYSVEGPDGQLVNPGDVVLVAASANEPMTLSSADIAALGVSNQFLGAPVEPNEVSGAGALYVGDSRVAPSVLTADSSASLPSQTPTASPLNDSQPDSMSPTAQFDGLSGAAAITSVPEPSTVFGVSLSLVALGWLKRRSKNR